MYMSTTDLENVHVNNWSWNLQLAPEVREMSYLEPVEVVGNVAVTNFPEIVIA